MKTGIFQFAPKFGDKNANLISIEQAVSQMDVNLIVLPELCLSGYQFTSVDEVRALSDTVPDGEGISRLQEIASDTSTYIVAGFIEKDGENLYNSAVLAGPAGIIGTYRKVHLFYEEKEFFCRGDKGFPVFSIPGATIGMMICFDWLFPEAARSLALQGADIICHPVNLVLPFCQKAMQTRCIENRVFAVTANRTGSEQRGGKEELCFTGQSQIVNPSGEVLFRLSEQGQGAQAVQIDPSKSGNKLITDVNDVFLDRRTDMYTLDIPE